MLVVIEAQAFLPLQVSSKFSSRAGGWSMRQTSLSIWHLQEMYITRPIAVSQEWHGNETGGLGMKIGN